VKAVASVVLGDDNVVFLDALSTVLTQHGHSVRAVAPSATELVQAVRRLHPRLCLINRYLEVDDSAEVVSRVLEARGATRVIVLSGNPESAAALRALDAGASGYVHKSRGVAALISAVDRTLLGNVVVDIPPAADPPRPVSPGNAERLTPRLTKRERECLAMLVEGLDTAAMVVKLGISRTTVRTHVQAVLNKLGVHSRLEAASLAVRSGMLDVSDDDIRPHNRRPNVPAFGPPKALTRVGAPVPRPRPAYPPGGPVQAGDRPA
jgi:two-component system, NarL family, nitrate/nitrite response regulator NarL